MKKLLLLVSTFLYFSSANAQCKVETDPFTKDLISKFHYDGVNAIQIGNDLSYPNFELDYDLKNGEGTLSFTYNYTGKLDNVLPAGGEVLFRLENEEILKFTTTEEAKPTSYAQGSQTWTKYAYAFRVSAADIEKLSKNKVELVRFTDASKKGNVDCKDYGKGIKKGAECVVKK